MNFKYLNLPTLPTEIMLEIIDIVNQNQDLKQDNSLQLNSVNAEVLTALQNIEINHKDSLGVPMSEAGDHFSNLAKFDFLEVSDKIKDWVYINITPTPVHISIQCMHGGKTITPHVDEARTTVFNYLLETANASTCFWKPAKGFDHLKAYPQTVFTYDKLQIEEIVMIEKHRWHQLDILKIHSVENITPNQRRISLSLSYL